MSIEIAEPELVERLIFPQRFYGHICIYCTFLSSQLMTHHIKLQTAVVCQICDRCGILSLHQYIRYCHAMEPLPLAFWLNIQQSLLTLVYYLHLSSPAVFVVQSN